MAKNFPKTLKSVILILLIGLIIRSIIAFYLYPGYDEAYYYLYSKNLDWSYFDHPVFVALTTGFGVWLTGEVNQFTIRLGTLLLYTISLYILYLISKKLFNEITALFTLIIASIIPIFQIAFGVLTLPDVPLIFFWSLTILCAVNEFFNKKVDQKNFNLYSYTPSYRLAILGILIGLACLSKYHGFILGVGIIGFCCTSKKYFCALKSPWLWLGIGLFFLTLFPLWYWNFKHDWISFTFQLSGRFQPNPDDLPPSPKFYTPLDILIVFLSGIGYLFPAFGIPLWWVIWRSLINLIPKQFFQKFISKKYLIFKQQNDFDDEELKNKILLILWVSLPLTIGFTLLGGVTQILPTWSMPGFWGLCLILGYYVQFWQKKSPKLVKRWLSSSALIIYTLILIALLHLTTGLLQKPNQYPFFSGLVSPKNDPSTELIDIIQLRENIAASPILTEALANSSFIFTNVYYLGGYIAMAIAPLSDLPVTCFSNDARGFMFWTSQQELVGKNGLYITSKRFAAMPKIHKEFTTYFANFTEIAQIPLKRAGEITEIFYVYQGEKLVKPYEKWRSLLKQINN